MYSSYTIDLNGIWWSGLGHCVQYFVFLQSVSVPVNTDIMLQCSSVSVLLISESAVTLWHLFIDFI